MLLLRRLENDIVRLLSFGRTEGGNIWGTDF